MIKKIIIGFFILINSFCSVHAQGNELEKKYQVFVSKFIDFVKANNKEGIANLISYPFYREYPIPSIKNKQEFCSRYNDIFDDRLIQLIVKSDTAKDWSSVGWRGIMLLDGVLWMSEDGKLSSINYQSSEEKVLKEKLISIDKNNIHLSLSNFAKPICVLKTSKFRIRIDDLGNENYRYASWSKNKPMKEKPDLVLKNGELEVSGTIRDQIYRFKNGNYVYECYIGAEIELTIYKNGKQISSQDAELILK